MRARPVCTRGQKTRERTASAVCNRHTGTPATGTPAHRPHRHDHWHRGQLLETISSFDAEKRPGEPGEKCGLAQLASSRRRPGSRVLPPVRGGRDGCRRRAERWASPGKLRDSARSSSRRSAGARCRRGGAAARRKPSRSADPGSAARSSSSTQGAFLSSRARSSMAVRGYGESGGTSPALAGVGRSRPRQVEARVVEGERDVGVEGRRALVVGQGRSGHGYAARGLGAAGCGEQGGLAESARRGQHGDAPPGGRAPAVSVGRSQ